MTSRHSTRHLTRPSSSARAPALADGPSRAPVRAASSASSAWAAGVLAAAVSALLLSGCGREGQAQAAPEGPPPAPPVSVAAVVSRAVAEEQTFSGRIEAVERAEIRPRVPGTVEAVRFKAGSLVRKGDVLFIIDPRPYRAEAARSEAAAAASRAKAELARTELERSRRLLADNAIAQRDFDERQSNARQLEAAARADEAAAAVARLNLDYTVVRAPFSGRVGKAEVTAGNLVDSTIVLTSLVSLDPVYVSFDGDEATFLRLAPAARQGAAIPVRVGLANEAGAARQGRLEFLDNRVDPGSASVRMRALLPNPQGELTPGLFARVQLGSAQARPAVLIAEQAVGTDQNRKFVYVVGADGKAQYRVIELGPAVDGLRVVRTGLQAGERVVVAGLQRVRPGAPVQPQVVPMPTPGGASAPAAAAPASAS
jgi:multidrug efflux system membrane fusion protein